jgi:hypothetical protein
MFGELKSYKELTSQKRGYFLNVAANVTKKILQDDDDNNHREEGETK